MGGGVVLLHDLQDLLTSMRVRDWIHRFYLSTASRVLTISVQATLRWVIVMDTTGWTSTLWVSERFIAIASIRWITLHSVVHSSDLDDRGTLLELHDGSFLAWLVVWIK